MTDPVVCSDGFIYEAESLNCWLQHKSTSPVTRMEITLVGVPLCAAQRAVKRAGLPKAA